jgi:anhydro-N-acetylmuramic acid kinase
MENPWDKLRSYAQKRERLIVGLMSGTSADGVDAVIVQVSGSRRDTKVSLRKFITFGMPRRLRERILMLSHGEGDAQLVSHVNVEIGSLFADAVETVLIEGGISISSIDAIASHGQTIAHSPELAATLQIGEPSILAQRFGVPVVSDFRSADMSAGGQGAPLVPYADWCLLTHPTKTRAIQNIGGIANVTYLPADASPESVLGFDTGPGNMLIDLAAEYASDGAETFDRDGMLASTGEIHHDLLAWLLNHPWILQPPPKSAGRAEFGRSLWHELLRIYGDAAIEHLTATVTAFTALSIADAYDRFLPAPPDQIVIGGGGVRNNSLMALLRKQFGEERVITHENLEDPLDSDAKEAIAFAILANETLLGNPSNLPSVTGARAPVILGKVTPGNY